VHDFLILGGYGNAGRAISHLLLERTSASLIIAGRCLRKAHRFADELNARYGAGRVSATFADASVITPAELSELRHVRMLVVASSTIGYTRNVATAALDAGIDYFDLQLSSPRKWAVLRSLAPRIDADGRCFVTDGGYHPGLPAALVRWAASRIHRLESATVATVMRVPWRRYEFSHASLTEFVEEFRDYRPTWFERGEWVKGWNGGRTFDFGAPYGSVACQPMGLEEMQALPAQIQGLRETGFFVSGFDRITDNVIIPFILLGLKAIPHPGGALGRLFLWSVRRSEKAPYGIATILTASGAGGSQVRLCVAHEDAYFYTAVPVVAALKQYLEGSLRRPGLHCQASVVDPGRFVRDLGALGLKVEGDR
jgi:saccharopine dehydrogenase (NAD+, L-lysine-forming)